jgi:hypothetical protein
MPIGAITMIAMTLVAIIVLLLKRGGLILSGKFYLIVAMGKTLSRH